jgi:hypothetical protein
MIHAKESWLKRCFYYAEFLNLPDFSFLIKKRIDVQKNRWYGNIITIMILCCTSGNPIWKKNLISVVQEKDGKDENEHKWGIHAFLAKNIKDWLQTQ